MSVFGVDFGSLNSTAAIIRHGGLDIVTNEVSKRETTTIVSFVDNERFIGEQGLDRYVRNAANTIFLIQRFIGMKVNDPHLEKEKRFSTCSITGDYDKRLMFGVTYCGEMQYFYPEQVLAMVLQRLRSYVNQAATTDPRFPADIRDCVLTVPCYYTAEQRRLIQQACEIARINCMSLINDTTSAAVDYGIFRGSSLKETEGEGQVVGILSIGYSATVFSVIKFWKGNCKVLARTFDRHAGTRDVDYALYQHFLKLIKEKYRLDPSTNSRASLRVLQACERLKYLLSANQQAPFHIENIMEADISIPNFERATLETLAKPIADRIQSLIKEGFQLSGVSAEQFHSIEMIGGGSRIPLFKRSVEEVLKRPPSFTLNASETVARGSAITAAVFSPKFQVREFKVAEISTYPIKLGYHVENTKNPVSISFLPDVNKVVTLLGPKDHYPKLLDVTIPKSGNFKLYAFYDPADPHVQANILPEEFVIGKWDISSPGKKSAEIQEVRVRVNLRYNGLVTVDSAFAVEYYEVEEVEEKKKEPSSDPNNNNNNNNNNNEGENKNEKDAAAGEGKEETEKVVVKKQKQRKIELGVTPDLDIIGQTSSAVLKFSQMESEMHARDIEITQTREKKNELESYILNNRSRVSEGGMLYPYITPEQSNEYLKLSEDYENWLYDEGEHASLEAYTQRVENLRRIVDPAAARHKNLDDVTYYMSHFRKNIEQYKGKVLEAIEKYADIKSEELESAAKKVEEALTWGNHTFQDYQKAPRTAQPTLTQADLEAKERELKVVVDAAISAAHAAKVKKDAEANNNDKNNNDKNNNDKNNNDNSEGDANDKSGEETKGGADEAKNAETK